MLMNCTTGFKTLKMTFKKEPTPYLQGNYSRM